MKFGANKKRNSERIKKQIGTNKKTKGEEGSGVGEWSGEGWAMQQYNHPWGIPACGIL